MEGQIQPQIQPTVIIKPNLRSIDRQLGDPFKMLKRHWAPILIAEVIMFFLNFLLVFISIFVVMFPLIWGAAKATDEIEFIKTFFGGYFWIAAACIVVAMVVVGLWCGASMLAALGYRGKGMAPIGESLKKGLKLFPALLLIHLMTMVAMMGGALMLGFPAAILALGISMTWFIKVNEDVTIFQAIGTSWEITKGLRWSILGRGLLLMLIVWGIVVALAIIGMIPIMGLVAIPVQFVVNFALAPYLLAYFYCIYEDIRAVRKEVYPMSGGLTGFMIACWLLAITYWSCLAFVAVYLLQKYVF